MTALRSSNPLLTQDAFGGGRVFGNLERDAARRDAMSLAGVGRAGLVLLAICLGAAVWSWTYFAAEPRLLVAGLIGSSLLGCVLVFACTFARRASMVIGPMVAACEGVLAGTSSLMWASYAAGKSTGTLAQLGTGLVLEAVLLTIGVAGAMLVAYATRLIRVTDKLRMGIFAATAGICLVSLLTLVLRLFGVNVPYIWGNGVVGLVFAGVIVVIAAFNLLLDFDMIESGVASGQPRYMNWYAAVGLLVTLVWLYLSVLRLLAQLNRRN